MSVIVIIIVYLYSKQKESCLVWPSCPLFVLVFSHFSVKSDCDVHVLEAKDCRKCFRGTSTTNTANTSEADGWCFCCQERSTAKLVSF